VLLAHNRYRYAGGEDEVVSQEAALLAERGHAVTCLTADNREISRGSITGDLRLALSTVWSTQAKDQVRDLVIANRPDIAHFHNTFPRISPAAYVACHEAGVPVVQTLHNYRLLCANALFFRDGQTCEACLGRSLPWPGVWHACYRDSRAASGVVAAMLTTHRLLGTWSHAVDVYIALTEFAKRKFVEGGLPPDRIIVKPNFVHPDPAIGDHRGGFALYVGRLSAEKGLPTLIEAWRLLRAPIGLKIVGDGPLHTLASGAPATIEWLGRQTKEHVLALMRDATLLVVPSEVYEGFPLALVEAFATGLPVVASRLGAMAEIVEDGATGLLFTPRSPESLAECVDQLLRNLTIASAMGLAGRDQFEARYTAERSYEILRQSYRLAQARFGT